MWWCICCCSGAGFLLTGCIALIVMIAENPTGFIGFVSSILGIAILLPALPYYIIQCHYKGVLMNDYIQVRIDKEDKDKASQIFEDIGIDISTAIRMFLKKSIKVNGLPFSVNDYEDLDYLSAMDNILEMKAEAKKMVVKILPSKKLIR